MDKSKTIFSESNAAVWKSEKAKQIILLEMGETKQKEKRSLLCLLQSLIGIRVTIYLKNDEIVNGVIDEVLGGMR